MPRNASSSCCMSCMLSFISHASKERPYSHLTRLTFNFLKSILVGAARILSDRVNILSVSNNFLEKHLVASSSRFVVRSTHEPPSHQDAITELLPDTTTLVISTEQPFLLLRCAVLFGSTFTAPDSNKYIPRMQMCIYSEHGNLTGFHRAFSLLTHGREIQTWRN
jgi:hypothetical protein